MNPKAKNRPQIGKRSYEEFKNSQSDHKEKKIEEIQNGNSLEGNSQILK